jgi:hypothetical protein
MISKKRRILSVVNTEGVQFMTSAAIAGHQRRKGSCPKSLANPETMMWQAFKGVADLSLTQISNPFPSLRSPDRTLVAPILIESDS